MLRSVYYNISLSMVFCDISSKDTKCRNHVTDWFQFRCCCCFGEKTRSAVKSRNGYRLFSTQPPTNSRPLAANDPGKLFAERPFWCPYRNLCRNLPVSLCTRPLIGKDKEPNSKLGLCSVERNKLLSYELHNLMDQEPMSRSMQLPY